MPRRHKTQKKRRTHLRRKTRSKQRRRSHRRGGVVQGINNNVNNNFFNENEQEMMGRREALIAMADAIVGSIEHRRMADPNIDEMVFVDEIRELEDEADEIDEFFGNHQMENMLNERIDLIMEEFNLIIQQQQINNNSNNNTLTIGSRVKLHNNSNYNSNNGLSVVSRRSINNYD